MHTQTMQYKFNQFTLDTRRFELTSNGVPIQAEPQVVELLILLVENRGRMVPKIEINEKVWKGRVVSEASLSSRIKTARHLLGDNGRKQLYIKTIHKKGFTFVGEVEVEQDTSIQIAQRNPEYPSIAVLPFHNLSTDPEQEYFSDGIAEDIITELSKVSNLVVTARSSTFTYKGREVDVRQVAREQNVQFVLEGSVRRSAGRVRVTALLSDAASSHQIWAEKYDRQLDDIFAVQDEIMREIVVALDVELREGEQARMWSSGTNIVGAWECVRLAAPIIIRSGVKGNLVKARQLLDRAIELDPEYAIAWVMYGWYYQNHADVGAGANDLKRKRPHWT